jgi:uroporphyrinogen-III decarboxylase
MSNQLYQERLERIKKAVALEPVDKVPFVPCANAYHARQQKVLMKDFISNYELQCTTGLKSLEEMGDIDGTQNTLFSPYLLAGQWLSDLGLPGVNLPDDAMWQVMESEKMKFEEYQEILDNGFEAFYTKFKKERLGDNDSDLAPYFQYVPTANQRYAEAGLPCVCDFLMITPFEYFCGGRSLECFFMDDLMEEPDMMDEVFAKVMQYTMKTYKGMMEAIKPIGVWIGGWRTAPDMLSPKMWERFVWPYLKAYSELCLEHDVIPIFHLDSNWTSQLERFREMPAKKCILALDSKTNIRKAKEVLGDMMCILGDVPAELLTFATPEEVYEHTTNLIKDVGPTGFILASGCDIPSDAKKENVQAMAKAASDFLKNQ